MMQWKQLLDDAMELIRELISEIRALREELQKR